MRRKEPLDGHAVEDQWGGDGSSGRGCYASGVKVVFAIVVDGSTLVVLFPQWSSRQ